MSVPLDKLQRYLANAGITQSAVRLGKSGKGVKGMRRTAVNFCAAIQLDNLPTPDEYPSALDQWTETLTKQFPPGGRFWGTARKCINIFMRDASYNTYLRNEHSLERLEPALEVPLDGDVANGLLKEQEAAQFGLKKWDALKRVTKNEHGRYQNLASTVARRYRVHRVHLDLLYWRPAPSPRNAPVEANHV